MNAMSEKLEEAGVDTIGARLTAACTEAIRQYPGSIAEAWRFVGATFGHEFVRLLMKDMQGNAPQIEQRSPPAHALGVPAPKPYRPHVIEPERLEKRRELRNVIRSKYKNSGGIFWSDVSLHELHALSRDGVEARALLDACPAAVPNDGRPLKDVLDVKRINEIIEKVRK